MNDLNSTVIIKADELNRIIKSAELAVNALRDAMKILDEVEHDERTERAAQVLRQALMGVAEANRKGKEVV